MKALHNFLEKNIKPIFDKGGKLEKLYPVYDGLETFLFVPGHVTKGGTHIKDGIDLKRTMVTVILALKVCMIFGMWNIGHQYYTHFGGEHTCLDDFLYGLMIMLPIIIVSYGVGLGIEFIFCIAKGHSIQEGFLVSGLLIPLVMPAGVPLWMVAVATAFAVVIGKEVFGGTGMNILNPALTARAFLFFAYPTQMSGDKVWVPSEGAEAVDGFSGATALGDLATTVGTPVGSNLETMSKFEAGGMYDMWNSFIGTIPGSLGETSALACLIGAAILLISGIGSWRIMLSMTLGGLAMALIFNQFAANDFMALNPIHQLLLGGFMFGMVFMATDPVSAAQTNKGKWIYGFLCGFLGIMIRVFNPAYPEGIMMAILFMNVMAPLVDHYVIQGNISKRLKKLKTA
jgi:Na+-transporting NADH:ubiquinone oxidoreductase subunit B